MDTVTCKSLQEMKSEFLCWKKKKRRKALAAFEPTAQAMEETFSTCVDLILDMGEGLKDAEGVAFT